MLILPNKRKKKKNSLWSFLISRLLKYSNSTDTLKAAKISKKKYISLWIINHRHFRNSMRI